MSKVRRKILMIAFHFPPCFGSSGAQRVLKFCQYLPENGWDPIVLTVPGFSHRRRSDDQLCEIPNSVPVHRTVALDAARHLSVRGRYLRQFASPDPWATWRFTAVPAGRKIIRRVQPDLIWSTFPIASAHTIAMKLQQESGIPWVADFRDVMTEGEYPPDPTVRAEHRKLEQEIVSRAQRVVLTTPGAKALYATRYSKEPGDKWCCVRNGYDEQSFENIEQLGTGKGVNRTLHLLHSGLLYPNERDPTSFYAAVASLKNRGVVSADSLRITLRSTGHDDYHSKLVKEYRVDDIVQVAPGISYLDAITEMKKVDGLLIFQASNCNNQIPAKLYEYFRAGQPIFALTDPVGDTAKTMKLVGLNTIAHIDNATDIEKMLEAFLGGLRNGDAMIPSREDVQQFSRRSQTNNLSGILNGLVGNSG